MRVRVMAVLAAASIGLSGCHQGVWAALWESPSEMSIAENLHQLDYMGGDQPAFREKLHQMAENAGVTDLRASQLALALAKSARTFRRNDAESGLIFEILNESITYSKDNDIDAAATTKFFGTMFSGNAIKSNTDLQNAAHLLDAAKDYNDGIYIADLMDNINLLLQFTPNMRTKSSLYACISALASLADGDLGLGIAVRSIIIANAAVIHGGANGESSRSLILSALQEANPELTAEGRLELMQRGLFGATDQLRDDLTAHPDSITNYDKIKKYIQAHLHTEAEQRSAYRSIFMLNDDDSAAEFEKRLSMSLDKSSLSAD